MGFIWLNKQGVQGDDGFIVQCVSRFIIEYREVDNVISISVESDVSNNQLTEYVKKDTFLRWDSGMELSLEKQKEVMGNFKKAMEFQGINVVFE